MRLIRPSPAIAPSAVHPFFIPDREVSLYFGAADLVVLPYADVLTSGTAGLAHSMSRRLVARGLLSTPWLVSGGLNIAEYTA